MVRTPKRTELPPNEIPHYELSRMQTRRDCSRSICLAVSRSVSRIAPPHAGHRQTASSLASAAAAEGAAASNVRQSGSS